MEANKKPLVREGRLIITEGRSPKIESVRTRRRKFRIVARPTQGDAPNVTVYEVEGEEQSNYMAFCFKSKTQEYFPVVTKQEDSNNEVDIQVVKKTNVNTLENKFFFKWVETTGDYKSLNSVAEPSKYLCIFNNEVRLGSKPEPLFKIVSEKSLAYALKRGSAHLRSYRKSPYPTLGCKQQHIV